MKRRTLLRLAVATAAWARWPWTLRAQAPHLDAAQEAQLRALAEVVLPGELGADGRDAVVDAFLRWMRNYREGAEMDHGYGVTRLRRTPPSPADRYPAQLLALDRAARAGGAPFESLALPERRGLVEAALDTARIERLPIRPTGDHIASDLMAFYFSSPAAADLAYRVAIGRDQCRGLPGSDRRPTPVQSAFRVGSESVQSRFRVGSESARSRR